MTTKFKGALSLDISSKSTGWSYTKNGKNFESGLILTKPKDGNIVKLKDFGEQLKALLVKYKPNYIVQEDTFSGINVNTLKLLSEFAGLSKYICLSTSNVEPYVISNNTVKAYYKVKTKAELFSFVCNILNRKELTFENNNDMIDAQAQLICYLDEVLGLYEYRFEKSYGYLYMEGIKWRKL